MNLAIGAAFRDLAKAVKQQRERIDQRRALKRHRRRSGTSGQELTRIKLSEADKQELQAKISELKEHQLKISTSRKMRRALGQKPNSAGYRVVSSGKVDSIEAYTSLVMGLFGLGSMLFISIFWSAFWLPFLAILFGVRALRTIREAKVLQIAGQSIAIAGISLGIISYIILALAIMWKS